MSDCFQTQSVLVSIYTTELYYSMFRAYCVHTIGNARPHEWGPKASLSRRTSRTESFDEGTQSIF